MEENFFEQIGLTKNECKVYSVLIKFGKLGSGEVSSMSGVSYGRIYDILNSLIFKGLVKTIHGKTKKFASSDPEHLIKLIEKKENFLKKAKEKAWEMKKDYEVREKDVLMVGEGKKGFYKIVDELEEAKGYSYSIRFTSEYNPRWVELFKKMKRKKVDIKILTKYTKENEEDVKDWLKVHKAVRKIENDGIALSIEDDKIVMISLIKNNITFLIRDKAFAKIMKKMFLETYGTAKGIK